MPHPARAIPRASYWMFRASIPGPSLALSRKRGEGLSPHISHKTEVCGVRLGLGSAEEVADATAAMLHEGFGAIHLDQTALAEAICRFARLAVDAPALAELEVNPPVAGPASVVAVDACARI